MENLAEIFSHLKIGPDESEEVHELVLQMRKLVAEIAVIDWRLLDDKSKEAATKKLDMFWKEAKEYAEKRDVANLRAATAHLSDITLYCID